MKNVDKIQSTFDFLIEHAKSGKSFKLDDLIKASNWSKNTATIYLSKKVTAQPCETKEGK